MIIKQNEQLKKHCTFSIGGNAKYFYTVETPEELLEVCKYCSIHNIKYKIIGMGANILFDDKGFNGAIIVNKCNNIIVNDNYVIVDTGVNLTNLIMKLYQKKLSGIEPLSGIPATVGGALVNNVGAFDCQICNYVKHVNVVKTTNLNKIITMNKQDCQFAYRNSIFKSNKYILLNATFEFNYDTPSLIKKRIDEAISKKTSSQPTNYPSAGSVFKRGSIIPAQVIDELGLKGTRIGDAEISNKHAGFIINIGNASSEDVKELIALIKAKVYEKYKQTIEEEIEIVEF